MGKWTQFERELISACQEGLTKVASGVQTQKTWLATTRELLMHADSQEPGPALVIASPQGTTRVELDGSEQVLGRADDCTVRLPYRFVSRRHAGLRRVGADWVFEDLGSANGTLINGLPCARKALVGGDVLQVGEATILFLPAEDKVVEEALG